jgi:hypothetical protein
VVEDWDISDPAGRPIEEIRRIADEILATYDEAPVRSFVMTLANRKAREILKERATAAVNAP